MSAGTPNLQATTAAREGDAILALYTELANRPDKDFGWRKGRENARALGYDRRWLDTLPDVLWESAAAVGNPFSVAPLCAGEVVLDLGCGAGADTCIAALSVGNEGRAIGIDLTPAMIEKARRVAKDLALSNVVFHVSDMTTLPLADQSVDVVISNGAINLTAHKACVFKEIYRVLKPRGRLQFADMVRTSATDTGSSWADCVAGTVEANSYIEMLRASGFASAEFVEFTGYKTAATTCGAIFRACKPNEGLGSE
jgi:SAM-dependent methyltransferase